MTTSAPPIPKIPATAAVNREPIMPAWWRGGRVLLAVVLLAAAAGDLLCPRLAEGWCLGLGAALGVLCFGAALLLLRRDLTRGEQVFLAALEVLAAAALFSSGNPLALALALAVPLFLLFTGTSYPIDRTRRYFCWVGVLSHPALRGRSLKGMVARPGRVAATVLSVLVGLAAFAVFMIIFASGNPVVEQVWNAICNFVDAVIARFHLTWDIVLHVFMWLGGVLIFGLWTWLRPISFPAPAALAEPAQPVLPHLPLMLLIGINLACLITNVTDIAYLWQHTVPAGVSLTAYLYDGAYSVMVASALAGSVLLILFRRCGSARSSRFCGLAGLFLLAQTLLLAVSVGLRLSNQIADHGFTAMRIAAGESLLVGLVLLVVLLFYMLGSGDFTRFAKRGAAGVSLLLAAFCIQGPTELAGTLNLCAAPSHPNWHFSLADFPGMCDRPGHLTFAESLLRQETTPAEYHLRCSSLHYGAWVVQHRADYPGWMNLNLSDLRDRETAQCILTQALHTDSSENRE